MKCPRGHAELVPGDVQGVAAFRCPDCDGTWLDQAGLEEATERADPDVGWLEVELWKDPARFAVGPRRLPCPTCGKPMGSLGYGETGVEIDVCPACRGAWLDPAEFENVVAALEQEAARLPARDLFAAALREAGELIRGRASLADEWRHATQILRLLKLRVLVDHPSLRRLLIELEKGTPFN